MLSRYKFEVVKSDLFNSFQEPKQVSKVLRWNSDPVSSTPNYLQISESFVPWSQIPEVFLVRRLALCRLVVLEFEPSKSVVVP